MGNNLILFRQTGTALSRIISCSVHNLGLGVSELGWVDISRNSFCGYQSSFFSLLGLKNACGFQNLVIKNSIFDEPNPSNKSSQKTKPVYNSWKRGAWINYGKWNSNLEKLSNCSKPRFKSSPCSITIMKCSELQIIGIKLFYKYVTTFWFLPQEIFYFLS